MTKPIETIADFQDAIEAACGERPGLQWEQPGPRNTMVKRHAFLLLGSRPIYLQLYERRGWEAFVPADDSNRVEATISAVIAACKVTA